jgi:hypothetical protein
VTEIGRQILSVVIVASMLGVLLVAVFGGRGR